MNNGKLLRWSVVAALAGFLFGFDTVVISGANLPIKELWHTSPWFHGFFIMSMALWGTVIGAIFGGIPTEKYGRKKVLFWIGILYTLSAVGTAFAMDAYTFSLFRFLGGIGIGVSSVVVPTYISEISTSKIRGRLVAMYQFNIVFGILVAFISNYLLKGFNGANDWRWMLGVSAIPSFLYTILVLGLPESPRWLISKKNDRLAAARIMDEIGFEDSNAEIDRIMASNAEAARAIKSTQFFSSAHGKSIGLAFLIAFFNQLSGINFILYYAPEILEMAGLGSKDSLFNSIAIGGVNLAFTFVGLYFVDRAGRKRLMLIGSIGYIVSLAAVAACFYYAVNPSILLLFLLLFIASHAIGQGTVIWVFIAEIFPNNVRALGQSFGASVHWVFAAIITLVAPAVIDYFSTSKHYIFIFLAFMMVLQLIWVLSKMPETKGVALEDMEKSMTHP